MISHQIFLVLVTILFSVAILQATDLKCYRCDDSEKSCSSDRTETCGTNRGCFKLATTRNGKNTSTYGCAGKLETLIRIATDPDRIDKDEQKAVRTIYPYLETLKDRQPAADKCATKAASTTFGDSVNYELCYCSKELCNGSPLNGISALYLALVSFFIIIFHF